MRTFLGRGLLLALVLLLSTASRAQVLGGRFPGVLGMGPGSDRRLTTNALRARATVWIYSIDPTPQEVMLYGDYGASGRVQASANIINYERWLEWAVRTDYRGPYGYGGGLSPFAGAGDSVEPVPGRIRYAGANGPIQVGNKFGRIIVPNPGRRAAQAQWARFRIGPEFGLARSGGQTGSASFGVATATGSLIAVGASAYAVYVASTATDRGDAWDALQETGMRLAASMLSLGDVVIGGVCDTCPGIPGTGGEGSTSTPQPSGYGPDFPCGMQPDGTYNSWCDETGGGGGGGESSDSGGGIAGVSGGGAGGNYVGTDLGNLHMMGVGGGSGGGGGGDLPFGSSGGPFAPRQGAGANGTGNGGTRGSGASLGSSSGSGLYITGHWTQFLGRYDVIIKMVGCKTGCWFYVR